MKYEEEQWHDGGEGELQVRAERGLHLIGPEANDQADEERRRTPGHQMASQHVGGHRSQRHRQDDSEVVRRGRPEQRRDRPEGDSERWLPGVDEQVEARRVVERCREEGIVPVCERVGHPREEVEVQIRIARSVDHNVDAVRDEVPPERDSQHAVGGANQDACSSTRRRARKRRHACRHPSPHPALGVANHHPSTLLMATSSTADPHAPHTPW